MGNNNLRIAFIGGTGFPHRIGAGTTRLSLMAKGLSENQCYVLVINRRGYTTNRNIPVTERMGKVIYTNSSGISHRPKSLMKRNWYKIIGAINEILLLKNKKIQVVIINTRSYWLILNYRIWSKVFNYKLFLSYVEYNSHISRRRNKVLKRINDIIFEKYVYRLLDGVFPISEFLKNAALKQNSGLPCLKIPVITDFNEYNYRKELNDPYFIYCGHAAYDYLIEFIIHSYELIKDNTIGLKLVIYGKPGYFKNIISMVKSSPKKNLTEILSDLPYNKLARYYINALGLLIPLKPSLRDISRFPHKIGEYTAAGNPIITNNYGEIKNYFTDLQNALIADKYDPETYADKMNYVIINPDKAKIIGTNGKLTGMKYFDYRKNCKMMRKFIEDTIKSADNPY